MGKIKYKSQWTFPSKSNPDKSYKVSEKEDGSFVCHCWPFLRNRDEPCSHIEAVMRGDIDPDGKPIEKHIVLAAVCQVMLGDDGKVYTPLIPIGDTWFQASLVYDLLRAGISWTELKERYSIAKVNSKKNIKAYIEERGRKVYKELGGAMKPAQYELLPANDPLPPYTV